MASASVVCLLFTLLAGQVSQCFPVSENDDVNFGNWLSDTFLEDTVSSSLADPLDMKAINGVPELILYLQPPDVEFQVPVQATSSEMPSKGDLIKHSPKKPSGVLQPSRYLQLPSREFGSNNKKTVIPFSYHYPVQFQRLSLKENLKLPLMDSAEHRIPERLPFGRTSSSRSSSRSRSSSTTTTNNNNISQNVPLPSIFAPLPTNIFETSQQHLLHTTPPTTTTGHTRGQDFKMPAKKVFKKKEEIKTKESKEGDVKMLPSLIEIPSRTLLPPTRNFMVRVAGARVPGVRVPGVLVPPMKEFMTHGDQ